MVALDDGGFLVTWEDVVAGTRGQRFDALGHQIGAEFTLDTGPQTGHRDAAVLDDGRIAFALDHVSIDFDVTTSIFTDDTPLDFNANGLSDILWQNDNGTPAIWLMNGLTRCPSAPPARSIRGRAGTSRTAATSTATASPTSCGRTTTARPRSG